MLFERLKQQVYDWSTERDPNKTVTLDVQVKKNIEEANEIEIAFKSGDISEMEIEIGDTLFSLIRTCKILEVTPERCLYYAIEKNKERVTSVVNGDIVKESDL